MIGCCPPIPVTPPQRVSPAECDNFLIIEPHAVEYLRTESLEWHALLVGASSKHTDIPKMVSALGSIWQATIWSNMVFEAVDSAGSPRNFGPCHFLPENMVCQVVNG